MDSRNQGTSILHSSGRRKTGRGRMAIDSDEEVEVARIREDSPRHPRHLKSWRLEEEGDFDVEVDDGGSKFSASPSDEEMADGSDSRYPRPPLNRPQIRQGSSTKASRGRASKKAVRAVISDDGDEEDGDSMPWRSDTADEDPPSSPPQTRAPPSSSSRTRKGKWRADLEDVDPPKEDRPVAIGTKRPRPLDSESAFDSKPPSPPTGPDVTAASENKEPAQKKKLPPIKKIKLSDSSASSPMPTSKAGPNPAKTEKSKLNIDGAGLPPPPSSLPRKPAATAGNADLDLSNADVYKQLFSTGNAPPKPGSKEKEERMRELHRMRDEARARRQREAAASFNLAAQHDKIEAFTSRLEARRSPALWPNTLAAKFKADMQDKMRAEQKAKQQQAQSHHAPPTDRKSNWAAV